jgi:hypothetical protein
MKILLDIDGVMVTTPSWAFLLFSILGGKIANGHNKQYYSNQILNNFHFFTS